MKNGKLLIGLGLAYATLMPASVIAQTMPEPTPRQVVVSFITGIPAQDIRFKPGASYALEPVLEEVTPPPTQNVLPPASPEHSLDNPPVSRAPIESKKSVTAKRVDISAGEDFKIESSIAGAETPYQNSLQPFYVTAQQYLMARSEDALDQIILEYEVTPVNIVTGLSADPKRVKLVIGSDFVAVTRESKTRIFDFKMRRLLTIRPSDAASVFDNTSLFPIALNNIETVKSATKNGTVQEIQIGPDKTLDAFWMEASLGWSARQSIGDLSVSYVDDFLIATYKGDVATRMKMDGPVLISEDLRSSFFAFLHHDVPIHPIVLKDLGLPLSAPSQLETVSFSPNFPNGLKTIWVLKSSETLSNPFPLSRNSQSAVSNSEGAPINFVIYNHMQGLAKLPEHSDDVLRQMIFEARTSGQYAQAWLKAKELESRLGACEADPALLCQDIDDLEASASPDSELGRLLWATKEHRITSIKATAFEVLMGYASDGKAPAFLVKKAGQMRARLKLKDLKTEKLRTIRADRLLEEALAKNPKDPETYRVLSQVYAAQGRYGESWDLQDALRRLPDVDQKLIDPINRVEKSLINQAPAFFIP